MLCTITLIICYGVLLHCIAYNLYTIWFMGKCCVVSIKFGELALNRYWQNLHLAVVLGN